MGFPPYSCPMPLPSRSLKGILAFVAVLASGGCSASAKNGDDGGDPAEAAAVLNVSEMDGAGMVDAGLDQVACSPVGWAAGGQASYDVTFPDGGDAGEPTVMCHPGICPRPVCGFVKSDDPDAGPGGVRVYADECAIPQGGMKQSNRSCSAPAGYFACEDTFCLKGRDYCARSAGDLNEGRCLPLPAACIAGGATPACGCVPLDQSCGRSCPCSTCEVNGDGDLVLTCIVA